MAHMDKKLEINIHVTRHLKSVGLADNVRNHLTCLQRLRDMWMDDRTITPSKAEWLEAVNDEIDFYLSLL